MANSEVDLRDGCVCSHHYLTFDIEDWHRGIPSAPQNPDSHLEMAMEVLLDTLAEIGVHGTFFVLGEDAGKIAGLLRRCVAEGHEVASHGMHHVRVDSLSKASFRDDVVSAFSQIEDITQVPCRGYRAPWFSLPPEMYGCFDILAEQGARYDSSLRLPLNAAIPVACRDAGMHEISVPILPIVSGLKLGVLSGLWFRGLPRSILLHLLNVATRAGHPGCLYLHPYEWLRCPVGVQRPLVKSTRRYIAVSRTLPNLKWLAKRVSFISIAEWLQTLDCGLPLSSVAEDG